MTGNRAERSLAKVLTWRLFAASNTLVCGVFFVGDINAALKIAGMDTALKTVSQRISGFFLAGMLVGCCVFFVLLSCMTLNSFGRCNIVLRCGQTHHGILLGKGP